MEDQLDQLVLDIASMLGVTPDEVRGQFSNEQLSKILNDSKCDPRDAQSLTFKDLEVPCDDIGNPLDLKNESQPVIQEDRPLPNPCIDAVDRITLEIEENTKKYQDLLLLIGKLEEIYDNIRVLAPFYSERANQMGLILKDFEPNLVEIKRITQRFEEVSKKIAKNQEKILRLSLELPSSRGQIDLVNLESTRLRNEVRDLNRQKQNQLNIITQKSAKYPLMSVNSNQISQFLGQSNLPIGPASSASTNLLSSERIEDLRVELLRYSEYIELSSSGVSGPYSQILKSPLIEFKVGIQNLTKIRIEREEFDKQTGQRSTYFEDLLIRGNPSIEDQECFNDSPGYTINDFPSKDISIGSLYVNYYNKLRDPISEFFTLEERGLTQSPDLVDPDLKGTDYYVKKEGDSEYYIQDRNRMQNFYSEFNSLLESRKEEVRSQVVNDGINTIRPKLVSLARSEVSALLSKSGANRYLPSDNSILESTVKSISNASSKFLRILSSLESEISRLKIEAEELKPDANKIKSRLKQESPECFKDIDQDPGECPDVFQKLGSDPFYETLSGVDPTLPNFTQLCYWLEFSKLATLMGLFPIPNDPLTFRYWPVGLVLPSPSGQVKVPLPIVWLPLICISTPLGVLVLFLTINGIFISPILFFVSASGFKMHLLSVRGSSPQFGFGQFEDTVKETINIPVGIKAQSEKEKRKNQKPSIDERETAKRERLIEKEQEAVSQGNERKARRLRNKISDIDQAEQDSIKSQEEKIQESLDKKESAIDAIKEAKSSIMRRIDNLGNPVTQKMNDLKAKAADAREKKQSEYVKSLGGRDPATSKILREELKTDGIDLNLKISAFSDDLLSYFDRIDLPKLTFPKESGKLSTGPTAISTANTTATEYESKKITQMIPKERVNVNSLLSTYIAKYKESLEEIGPPSLNVSRQSGQIKDALKRMAKQLTDIAAARDAKEIDPKEITEDQEKSQREIDREEDPSQKEKKKKKFNKSLESTSKLLDLDNIQQVIGFDPALVAQLSSISIDFNPFDPCCSKPEFKADLGDIGALIAILSAAYGILSNYIDNMSETDLQRMFGGKPNIGPRDLRLGLLDVVRNEIPLDLSIPTPDLNIGTVSSAFSGILGSLSVPQLPLPPSMQALSVPSQITIDLNILKDPLKNLIESFIKENIGSFPINFEKDFTSITGKDVKAFLKQAVESVIDELLNLIESSFSVIEFAKSAKGVSSNPFDQVAFNSPPYGPILQAAFNVKGAIKQQLPNSLSYSQTDIDVLTEALQILKPALSPIATSPVAYILVAAAAVTDNLELIRKLHPILNQDDIPPWERLTLQNVLFLVFLDEFISNAADLVGFYRSYV